MSASAQEAAPMAIGKPTDAIVSIEANAIDPDLSSAFAPRDPPIARDGGLHPILPSDLFATSSRTAEDGRAVHRSPDAPRPRRVLSEREGRRSMAGATLQRGAILDKYRIEAPVGTGGFAIVYRATHLLMQRRVALKLIRPDILEKHPESAQHLIEEARLLARIDHPNVVRVYDVTHSETITYVAMEYVDGGTLASTIDRQGPLPPDRVLRIALDIAQGLEAGLTQGLVHRDVKPANILMSHDGVARLVDFGLAHRGLGEIESHRQEGSRTIIGTRGYMAPEQALYPDRVTFRADVYALGATLYEAAMGVPLRPRDRYGESGKNSVLRDTTEAVRRAPSRLRRLLGWMLAPRPEGRPSSYRALVAELEATLRHSTAGK